jgi:hypothetical protein
MCCCADGSFSLAIKHVGQDSTLALHEYESHETKAAIIELHQRAMLMAATGLLPKCEVLLKRNVTTAHLH